MKTLTKNNVSIFLIEDDTSVTMDSESITVGDPVEFIITDCNSGDTVQHEGVTAPDDWYGHKYTYEGTTWSLVAGWVDPGTGNSE